MSIIEDSKEIFENIKKVRPVMHNISNIVTANDCANITLACGGSPTMADDPDEVEDITSACNGFVLNMGNTGGFMVETMLRAGKKSNEVNHPTVLDPVGAGAAKRRNQVLETLLKEIKFSVIRGNVSEIKFAGSKSSGAKGVDAAEGDKVTEENLDEMIRIAKILSKDFKFVRVDLYELERKVYFGELTFSPAHCVFPYLSDKFDLEMGKLLQI